MMKPKDIDANAWAEGVIHAKCMVNGGDVDPWLIGATVSSAKGSGSPLLIQLPTEVLRFELSQAGVDVGDSEWLLGFVRDDLSNNSEVAMNGYLNILRGVLCPRHDSRGFIQRLFSRRETVQPKWSWSSVENIGLVGPLISINGWAEEWLGNVRASYSAQ